MTFKDFLCITMVVLRLYPAVFAGEFFTTSQNVKYYIESAYKYTWYDAFLECSFRNMSLYTIENQAQFEDLYQVLISDKFPLKPPHLWIGAVGVNGRFVWVKTRQPLISPLWGFGNPDNSGNKEHCIQIWQNNKLLNDADCLSGFGFICEFIRAEREGKGIIINEGKYKGFTLNLMQRK